MQRICSYKCNYSSIHPLTTQHPTLVVKLCFECCTLGLGLARYLLNLDWNWIDHFCYLDPGEISVGASFSFVSDGPPTIRLDRCQSGGGDVISGSRRVNKPLKPATILQSSSYIFCKVTQTPYKRWTICRAQQGCPPPPFEGFYRGE